MPAEGNDTRFTLALGGALAGDMEPLWGVSESPLPPVNRTLLVDVDRRCSPETGITPVEPPAPWDAFKDPSKAWYPPKLFCGRKLARELSIVSAGVAWGDRRIEGTTLVWTREVRLGEASEGSDWGVVMVLPSLDTSWVLLALGALPSTTLGMMSDSVGLVVRFLGWVACADSMDTSDRIDPCSLLLARAICGASLSLSLLQEDDVPSSLLWVSQSCSNAITCRDNFLPMPIVFSEMDFRTLLLLDHPLWGWAMSPPVLGEEDGETVVRFLGNVAGECGEWICGDVTVSAESSLKAVPTRSRGSGMVNRRLGGCCCCSCCFCITAPRGEVLGTSVRGTSVSFLAGGGRAAAKVCLASIDVVVTILSSVLPIAGSSSKLGIGSGYADGKKAGLPDRRFLWTTGSSPRFEEIRTTAAWSRCRGLDDDTRFGVWAALGVVDCIEWYCGIGWWVATLEIV